MTKLSAVSTWDFVLVHLSCLVVYFSKCHIKCTISVVLILSLSSPLPSHFLSYYWEETIKLNWPQRLLWFGCDSFTLLIVAWWTTVAVPALPSGGCILTQDRGKNSVCCCGAATADEGCGWGAWRTTVRLSPVPTCFWHATPGAAKGGRGRWGRAFQRVQSEDRVYVSPPHRGPLELPPSGCLCCGSLEDVSKSCPWSVWLLDRPLSVYRGNHFCSLSHRLAVARALTTRSLCGSEGTEVRGFQTSWQLLCWSSHPGHNQLFDGFYLLKLFSASFCIVTQFCYCCSVAKSELFVDPMDCSTPGLPVLHYLLGFA